MADRDGESMVAVVLAAGMATRMGSLKQLLPIGDRTLIEWVVDQLTPVIPRVVVVVGHRAPEVTQVLAGRPVQCITNQDYAAGMCTSVQCAIRNTAPASAYLICLGDQPVLTGVLAPLLAAAGATEKGLVVPTFGGRRGHPLLIRRRYVPEVLGLGPGQGLNTLTRTHREDTLEVPVAEPGALEDMDTPADYQRVLQRLQEDPNG